MASSETTPDRPSVKFDMRWPLELLSHIDAQAGPRRRSAWLRQAAEEKLKRERAV